MSLRRKVLAKRGSDAEYVNSRRVDVSLFLPTPLNLAADTRSLMPLSISLTRFSNSAYIEVVLGMLSLASKAHCPTLKMAHRANCRRRRRRRRSDNRLAVKKNGNTSVGIFLMGVSDVRAKKVVHCNLILDSLHPTANFRSVLIAQWCGLYSRDEMSQFIHVRPDCMSSSRR